MREHLQVEPLLHFIEKGKLRLNGYLLRMREQRMSRRYLQCTPAGKCRAGRSRIRGMKGIEDARQRKGSRSLLIMNGKIIELTGEVCKTSAN